VNMLHVFQAPTFVKLCKRKGRTQARIDDTRLAVITFCLFFVHIYIYIYIYIYKFVITIVD
jgi:hypothetical protein